MNAGEVLIVFLMLALFWITNRHIDQNANSEEKRTTLLDKETDK